MMNPNISIQKWKKMRNMSIIVLESENINIFVSASESRGNPNTGHKSNGSDLAFDRGLPNNQ